MKLLILVFSACLASSIHGQKLHEHMTKEEIESVFKVPHQQVHELEYDVVPIFHKKEEILRSSTPRIHLRAFNKNYTLYLEENNHVLLGSDTPVYIAKAASGRRSGGIPKIAYSRMAYPFPENFKLYHDVENRAAITMHTDDHKIHVHGTVGDDIVIRSLPSRVHREVLNSPSFLKHSANVDTSSYQITHHVAIRPDPRDLSSVFGSFGDNWNKFTNSMKPSNLPVFGSLFGNQNQKPEKWIPTNIKPTIDHRRPHISRPSWAPVDEEPIDKFSEAPEEESADTLYPELLVVVDYETFMLHGSDVKEVAKYMAALWNAVDLRYRELEDPKIRLNIAGLIIPKQADATEYITRYAVGSDSVLEDKTLDLVGEYFAKDTTFPKDKYDIVIAVTPRMLGFYDDSGTFKNTTAGIANLKGVCLTKQGASAVLMNDNGGFKGIITAAHEIGHVMGARHDFEKSSECAGYMMDYKRSDAKGLHWSPCSISEMRKVLKSKQAQCLKNKPNVGKPYPKILPGKLLTRDEQCKLLTDYPVADKRTESDCAVLTCARIVKDGRVIQTFTAHKYLPPAEGTYCGEGKICLDAKCVDDPKL